MRAFTLIADLLSVALLLGWLPSISALTSPVEASVESDVSDKEAVQLPNYDLYGGPQENRGAYDYVITIITYGGYGPPPAPTTSSIVSSSLSSAFNQSFSGTVTSSVLSSSPPTSTLGASSGVLPSSAGLITRSMLTLMQVYLYLACLARARSLPPCRHPPHPLFHLSQVPRA